MRVHDSLADIEHGVTFVPFAAGQEPRRLMLPFVAAAASIALVVGTADLA